MPVRVNKCSLNCVHFYPECMGYGCKKEDKDNVGTEEVRMEEAAAHEARVSDSCFCSVCDLSVHEYHLRLGTV